MIMIMIITLTIHHIIMHSVEFGYLVILAVLPKPKAKENQYFIRIFDI